MHRLYYTLRGIKRLQGNSFQRPPRAPFTLKLIKRFSQLLYKYFPFRDFLMLKSAALLAFFGLLRASEYLSQSSAKYDPQNTLSSQDISFARDMTHASIRIKQSKTDPFRQGCSIKIWALNNAWCPVLSLHAYYSLLDGYSGPLFRFSDGSFLTRNQFSSIIHKYLPNINLNTHSFRIGGASAAHAAGVPDSTIKALGRWASNAFRIYLRLPDTTIQKAQQSMLKSTQNISWYPSEEQGE